MMMHGGIELLIPRILCTIFTWLLLNLFNASF